ncbi:MAG: radical SAM protein [Deltaproteobacteria bacterium]|nr:radical SAM protein [Deltaproteobacteria bacterium]
MARFARLANDVVKLAARHPRALLRAAGACVRTAFLRQKVLRSVEVALTYRCQAACRHCWQISLHDPASRELTMAEVERASRECVALGAANVHLTGGEPLLRDDICEIVAACGPGAVLVSMSTNGILLDRTRSLALKSAGLRMVSISIDGSTPAAHDACRGREGCFEAALAGTRYAREAGLQVFWNTIVNSLNIDGGEIRRIVELADRQGVVLTVNLPAAPDMWDPGRGPALSGEHMAAYRSLLALSNVRWEGGSNYGREGCPAGVEKVFVSPYGEVMPCVTMRLSYGNVRELPVRDIWRRMIAGPPFDRIHDRCLVAKDGKYWRRHLGPPVESGIRLL